VSEIALIRWKNGSPSINLRIAGCFELWDLDVSSVAIVFTPLADSIGLGVAFPSCYFLRWAETV
jgi:hypothetical protein